MSPAFRRHARGLAARLAPGYMAERARRFERAFRHSTGTTALAHRLVEDGWLTVRAGACAGLRYPMASLESVDAAVAKGIGSYECELTAILEAQLGSGPGVLVNIGCADGYFTVGLACRNPELEVVAYDISRSARSLCAELAAANGCADRVTVRSRFTAQTHVPEGAFVLCDIEGAEATLFDDALAGRLRLSHVIVEAHHDEAGQALEQAFARTHARTVIQQQPRSPERWPIAGFTEQEWQVAVSEWREPNLEWAYFTPLAHAARPSET